ncbi:retrovirus-related Pol polyprotein from transposon [Elysia marginata]|uniref:Retrovirus-related Pol polyprotein from transposon n=1 Tax=Elysia marginata TaxID=1093978 RepID=A0AAV4HHH1_9GAST|nr:retrovirus-related Pol polyprotein from transposon [Elysia marginata]
MKLPRLELMGALLVARLLVFVKNALKLPMDTSYCCFTDLTIVLGWIKADPSKWKQFVGNRVSEIQNLTNPSNWAHCAGRNNPADLLTRGITATELVESHFWLQGCSTDPELEVYDLSSADLFSSDEENLMETSAHDTVLSTVTKEAAPLVIYENFSQFSKIVRVIGWVERFIFNLRNSHRRLVGSLTQLELKESETFLLMSIQREAYFEDINALQKNQLLAKKSGLYKLDPFLGEDGLLRVKG